MIQPSCSHSSKLETKIRSELFSSIVTLWRGRCSSSCWCPWSHWLPTLVCNWSAWPWLLSFQLAALIPSYHVPLMRCSEGASTVTGIKVFHTLDPLCSQSYLLLFPNMDSSSSEREVLINLWNSNASFCLWLDNNSCMPRMFFFYLST